MADTELEIVPVSTTTATSLGGPAKGKPISRRILRPWERYVAVGHHRTIRKDLGSCSQQSRTRVILQSVFLGVLRMYHPILPRDPWKLMGASRECPERHIGPGVYVYFGLEKALLRHLSWPSNRQCTSAHTQLHLDGLSHFNASKTQVWPIPRRVVFLFKTDSFIVGQQTPAVLPSSCWTALTNSVTYCAMVSDAHRITQCSVVCEMSSVIHSPGASLGR
ncbi:hypothetical protein EG68_10610 [Paragonimus skrjabini miyazakii]|uniref:Uncharacterized protein n=1 Tax=Paragonimus skrjabini miyazakii TaxID=59628 RepID=A0A8S9YFB3_9TREM|nr:hypothetical protein EG68_10610 [Paragonimus skrjabini miyazakii]